MKSSFDVYKVRQQIPQNKQTILLVDFYNLFIRNFHAVPLTNSVGEHIGGIFGTLRSLKSAVEMFGPSEVYIISDGPHSSVRRKLMNKEYKANRNVEWKRGIVKAYDFLNEKEHKENFSKQIQRLREYFDVLPIKWISIPYIEADDVIAEICYKKTDKNYVIYSTDSDYKQLINNNTFCYNPASKKLFTIDTFLERYLFLPDNYIYFKSITGDKSDNLSGIKGIGEKTFVKLFPETNQVKINNLQELLTLADHKLNIDSKKTTKSIKEKYKAIIENKNLIEENIKLMQLEEVNISLLSKKMIKEFVERNPNKFNKNKLTQMLIVDDFEDILNGLQYWLSIFSKVEMRERK